MIEAGSDQDYEDPENYCLNPQGKSELQKDKESLTVARNEEVQNKS